MEGWNDCPPVMLQANSSSTTISSKSGKRRVKRVAHDYSSANSFQVSLADTSSTSVNSTTPKVYQGDFSDSWVEIPKPNDGKVGDLDTLLQLPTRLSTKEFEHYKKKVTDAVPNLSSSEQEFLNGVIARTGTISEQEIVALKNDILNYAMTNSNVSGWCIPLKKIIENIQI